MFEHWNSLLQEERLAVIRTGTKDERWEKAYKHYHATLDALKSDPLAEHIARKLPMGTYLINSVEDIIAHCEGEAKKVRK